MTLPEPPDLASLEPQLMTASELQAILERLFDWLHLAEDLPELAISGQRMVEAVRDALNMLLEERRERHSDESGRRGG
jgi:predicted component of type VI protein secretion system